MPEYRIIQKALNGWMVECKVCDSSETLFHRTFVKHLRQITKDGVIKPSTDSGVVSLSASELHTYGGTVRMVFSRKDIPETQPMCYVTTEKKESYRIYQEEREKLARTNPRTSPSYNWVDAKLGMTPDLYERECESYTREPIGLSKAKVIEYWLSPSPGIIEEPDVSCSKRHPSYIDGTGWSGGTWDGLNKELREVKAIADANRIPFRVKSCFTQVRLGWNRYVSLDDDNLSRLSDGKEAIITDGIPPDVSEKDCKC